ncbi:hypothetical protein TrVE_jg3870 [Triparma verrucosa]|uniref:Phosphoglucomutase n=1 Tax=Triparma verrucosa TaxID=1606542 RepID=A0A9W7C3T3_9STRA|nr:hypothetical protein TrVE_jg3870 [Triparma verrucosa]
MDPTLLKNVALEWLSNDPSPECRSLIQSLLTTAEGTGDYSTLSAMFSSRITFGTAGLRSKMSPGPSNINDLIIIQTAQGLIKYLKSYHGQLEGKLGPAIIGYDHRKNQELNISSKRFGQITKAVFTHHSIPTILLDGYVPTPLVPFAVKELGGCCGVMVTASHNPKYDNGYKLYWSDGCQITEPHDSGIQSSIMQPSNLKPQRSYDIDLVSTDVDSTSQLLSSYYAKIKEGMSSNIYSSLTEKYGSEVVKSSGPKLVYTAMHGVGSPYVSRVFSSYGLPEFMTVPEQNDPDSEFPTVGFPNPEEKGALDMSIHHADKNRGDVILANDPDADRLAVAEKDRESGEWTVFKGDQIGVMLGRWMWERRGRGIVEGGGKVAMCASAVSSKMLGAMAKEEGFRFEETLTGFKWIGRRAGELREEGYRVLLGYEEAIGFCCGEVISDKDGVSGAAVFAELAYWVYVDQGLTLKQWLNGLYQKYGEFVSNNGYFFCYDPAVVMSIIDKMRNGGKYFDKVGKYEVVGIRDLGVPGYDSSKADKVPTLPLSASSPMISVTFANGTVAQFRASGTEPKFKYYIEMAGKPGVKRDVVEQELKEMVEVLLEELLKPDENGLVRP